MGGAAEASDRREKRRLETIFDEARGCSRCPTMHGRPRVLSAANGSETARCLVVGEAPGMHGAAETGVPLRGDRTGDAFDRLLGEAGIGRDELFVTNAVLCSPRADDGASRKPLRAEVVRCSHFVRELVGSLDPAIVVTLGSTALASLEVIEPHALSLKWDVGEVHRWYGRFVLPLYHPGARAMIVRPWADQLRDYKLLRALLDTGSGADGAA